MMRTISLILGVIAAPAVIYVSLSGGSNEPQRPSGQLVIPNLSLTALAGREQFAAFCGACHGAYGEGSDNGPVLIHTLYGQTLFEDAQIVASVRQGAEARHWPFGNMPAIEGVSDEDLAKMIGFLREVQIANGIE